MFDPAFELNVSLRFAQAAYDSAAGLPLQLPDGYRKTSDIVVNNNKLQAHLARATPAQRTMVQSMALKANRPEIFGVIAQNSETIVISFRGTLTPDDWLRDLEFGHVPFQFAHGFGNVHEGFQFVYEAIEASVKEGLAACGPRSRTLIVGHSLGAALSVLCAPDLANNPNPPSAALEVHSFAGPRVAAPDIENPFVSTFAQQFGKAVPTCFRITNRWDVVPNLPPAVTHYQHVGTGVDVDGGFTCDLIRAHSLHLSYEPALCSLASQPAPRFHAARVP